jgi:DNA polymerase V
MHELLVGNEDATTLVLFDSDAMVGIGILKGNLLVVDRSLDPKDGSIVLAVVDGEILVRFLRLSTSRPILEASNPSYPAIELTNRDDIEIRGVITFNIAACR